MAKTQCSKTGKRTNKKRIYTRKSKKTPKVVQHADFLSLLNRLRTKKQRDQLFELASKSQIDSIAEIITNILRGTITLSKAQQDRLRRYKNCLRILSTNSVPLQHKKAQLRTYSGGFIGTLIGAAIPAIASLLGGLFKGSR